MPKVRCTCSDERLGHRAACVRGPGDRGRPSRAAPGGRHSRRSIRRRRAGRGRRDPTNRRPRTRSRRSPTPSGATASRSSSGSWNASRPSAASYALHPAGPADVGVELLGGHCRADVLTGGGRIPRDSRRRCRPRRAAPSRAHGPASHRSGRRVAAPPSGRAAAAGAACVRDVSSGAAGSGTIVAAPEGCRNGPQQVHAGRGAGYRGRRERVASSASGRRGTAGAPSARLLPRTTSALTSTGTSKRGSRSSSTSNWTRSARSMSSWDRAVKRAIRRRREQLLVRQDPARCRSQRHPQCRRDRRVVAGGAARC